MENIFSWMRLNKSGELISYLKLSIYFLPALQQFTRGSRDHIMLHFRSTLWDYFFYRPSRAWAIDPELQAEEIHLKTPDRKLLVCLYIKTAVTQKKGAIFLLHGRGGNAARYAQYARPLIYEGYDVFIMGYRGYGKSTGQPNHQNVLSDSALAFGYFSTMPRVKQEKKIIWGLSLGAQVAIRLAKIFPYDVDALVTEGAVASFKHAFTNYVPGLPGKFFQWFISLPYSAEEDIKTLQVPKLIIHSRDDEKISMANSAILYANASEPKLLLTIGGDHIRGLNKQQSQVYITAFNKIVAFNKGIMPALPVIPVNDHHDS